MTAEERILRYLDGSLSESDSAELLHELSVSPEKRVVLEQHLKLAEMTRAAQKPFEVPAELEENMRRRLPLVIPSETVAPTVLRRGAISSLLLLLRQYPTRFALGGMILLISAAGAYLLSNSNSNTRLPSTQISQTVQNTSPTPKETPTVEPKNNTAPASGASSVSTSTSERSIMNSSVKNQNRSTQSNHASNQLSNHSSSTAHRLTRNSNSVVVVKEESLSNTTLLDHSTSEQTTPPAPSSIGVIEAAPILSQPVAAISQSEIREPYRLNPFESKYNGQRSPWTVRVSLGYAETFLNVSSGDNTYTARLEGMPFIGVNYSLDKDQTWAIGAVIGKSSILTVSPQTQISTIDGVNQVVAHTYSTNSNEWLARLAARYTFHVVGNFKGEASIEGGALLSSMSPMASLQLLAVQPLTDAFEVQFGFLSSAVWTAPQPIQVGDASTLDSSTPTVYRTKSIVTQSKIFSPAITFRAGLQYRF